MPALVRLALVSGLTKRVGYLLAFRFPSCEKRCPQEASLQSYRRSLLALASSLRSRKTHEWLVACMGADMNLKMGLLEEDFRARWYMALVLLPSPEPSMLPNRARPSTMLGIIGV